jgi:hypothetical protein
MFVFQAICGSSSWPSALPHAPTGPPLLASPPEPDVALVLVLVLVLVLELEVIPLADDTSPLPGSAPSDVGASVPAPPPSPCRHAAARASTSNLRTTSYGTRPRGNSCYNRAVNEPVEPAALPWWRRPEVLVPGAVGLFATILYARTLCPTVYWYDSAEFAANAASLGVPHPPGYPLYTMIAHAFTWLPGEPALGVNVMSMVFAVGCVVLTCVLTRRLGGSWAAAVVASTLLATLESFWTNAVVAEVYTPGLFFTLGVLAILERAHEGQRPRLLTVAALVGGLGVGMHMSIATFGLGYAWLVATWGIELGHPRDLRRLAEGGKARLRRILTALAAAIGGLLVFAYVPIRSFEKWDEREWTIFRKNAMGGTFKRKFLHDYDLGERLELVAGIFVDNLLLVGIALAAIGAGVLLARRPKLGVGLLLCALGNAWWFFNYLVPDLDVFYLPTLALACIWAGFGAEAVAELLARRLHAHLRLLSWAALALPAFLVARNYARVDLSDETEAAEWGERACRGVASGARILLYSSPPEWRYYSVFLYVQDGLQQCRDVEIWRKPKVAQIRRALVRGEPIYMFHRVGPISSHFEVENDGGLLRLQLR